MKNNVTLIPATISRGNRVARCAKPKLRVAAYCRVSTDSDEQASSYEMQVAHYTEYISRNPEWELAGIYADEGISGTNTKKREKFNEMIEDCMAGKIDRVITKSISRFARNTLDCLKYVRQLRDKNIAIIFEKENINTLEASGELLLTIMASLAQQESESLSQNVKMGIQFRFQQGKVVANTSNFLGFTRDKDGNLVVVEEEAKIVRRIFREYLEGSNITQIANGLMADGIKPPLNSDTWHPNTIKNMLHNEKYMGDALLQKTITLNFIEKTRMKNDGSVPQYYVKDSHEAIIPKDIFTLVQEESLRRANLRSGKDNQKKRSYHGKFGLSSICVCTKCGDVYRRLHRKTTNGRCQDIWKCCTRISEGPKVCNARQVSEAELQMVTVKAINEVIEDTPTIVDTLMKNIDNTISDDSFNEQIEQINNLLIEKQNEMVKLANANRDYSALYDESEQLRGHKKELEIKKAQNIGYKRRIEDMRAFLNNQPKILAEYDDKMVRIYIEKINIYDDRFEVIFKAGITVNVDRS